MILFSVRSYRGAMAGSAPALMEAERLYRMGNPAPSPSIRKKIARVKE